MGGRRSRQWQFWWICHRCDKLRLHLVNECAGEPAWARCGTCTSLFLVTDTHRDQCFDPEIAGR